MSKILYNKKKEIKMLGNVKIQMFLKNSGAKIPCP